MAMPRLDCEVPHRLSNDQGCAFGPMKSNRGEATASTASTDTQIVLSDLGKAHCDKPTGNHSHSISWTSDEEKLRGRFTSMRNNALHLGFHKSPCLPRDVVEYTRVLVELKVRESRLLRERLQQDRRLVGQRKDAKAALEHRARLAVHPMILADAGLFNQLIDTPVPWGPVQPLFHGKEGLGQDGRSAVLAIDDGAFSRPLPGDSVPQENDPLVISEVSIPALQVT